MSGGVAEWAAALSNRQVGGEGFGAVARISGESPLIESHFGRIGLQKMAGLPMMLTTRHAVVKSAGRPAEAVAGCSAVPIAGTPWHKNTAARVEAV